MTKIRPDDNETAAALIRRLREESGLTQSELAERVGTTQSVISRLEREDYEGHTLSMLRRIGSALRRRIVVTTAADARAAAAVAEGRPSYGSNEVAASGSLSPEQVDALVARLAERFGDRGVTEQDVRAAIRWTRTGASGRESRREAVARLRGAVAVGPGDVAADIRRARSQRGRKPERRH